MAVWQYVQDEDEGVQYEDVALLLRGSATAFGAS